MSNRKDDLDIRPKRRMFHDNPAFA